jgi:hypothetical protein
MRSSARPPFNAPSPWPLAALLLPMVACGDCGGSGGHAEDDTGTAGTDSSAASGSDGPCVEDSGGDDSTGLPGSDPLADDLTPLRVLRRASFVLLGAPPTDAEMAELLAAGDEAAQLAWIENFIDAALDDDRFYATSFELGRTWLNVRLVDRTADEPEYGPKQQRVVIACEADTAQAGALHYFREDPTACDAGSPSVQIEPWWAPGTTATLVGHAANTTNDGVGSQQGNPIDITCEQRPEGTCGCGPNGEGCWFDPGTYPGWAPYIPGNPDGQRRLLAEEPARLFAHLVWHDRPATDLILADYSVGPTEVQVAYVMQGIEGGKLELASDDSWWRPSKYADELVDPLHEAGDPKAWREFTVADRNPFFLADRNYTFDPRQDFGPSAGIPSAGMLTSLGFLAAYPRERLRAARALETLACEQLLPPGGDVEFNPYVTDPGLEGPCQHCHTRIDPAALHFKRYAKAGSAFEGWGARYVMPGVGDNWQFDPIWREGQYPFSAEPFAQWNKWYRPGSLMTPATEAEVAANPYAMFLDFLPPDETLLGQVSDGTVGPLGFAKMIVEAGAFDRCIVRRLHERILGRDIDPAAEVGYLDALTDTFVQGGRVVRPFIKALTQSEDFRRGR